MFFLSIIPINVSELSKNYKEAVSKRLLPASSEKIYISKAQEMLQEMVRERERESGAKYKCISICCTVLLG